MSHVQRRKHGRSRTGCRVCGGPTGHHAVCTVCSPTKTTASHRDKYADKRANSSTSEGTSR